MIDTTKTLRTMVAAAGSALLATATWALQPAPAHADTFVPLPGGQITETLGDGTTVTVRLTGESAVISPSLGSTPLHRNTWVSGSAGAEASQPPRSMSIRPGYVVGCQVNIAGGGVNAGAGATQRAGSETPDLSTSTGGNLTLGPGQAKKYYLLDLETPDAFGDESHRPFNRTKSPVASVTWKDSTIGLAGCAGYAQARAFVQVDVETSKAKEIVTLWGQPFSLG
ncbi:MspA family porin [Nocardia carnea]|uniref:MspA family porin n=1 Tax=Nocardia carnea TaxID=37328 RepID=UPI002456D84A|nr:MspA family porin [Nocardia carnea]